ncbi:MAG: DUF1287 domain-containing protein [Bacteroidia bacterium]|jgi:uncharacterized protein YijF (DUF1287 family)|nr:MAG: DUF1287 domain-containing protein [Bacteroidia bacterium]
MNRAVFLAIFAVLTASVFGQPGDLRFEEKLSNAALSLTLQEVVYDPAYYSMDYPGGDVPAGRGVCTDVIIRAYRILDIDLQKEVHEDMEAHFTLYPKLWGLSRPDSNIDHRRVPNLMLFFERHGIEKEISEEAGDYVPGDVVCWNLGGAVTHIGIVVDRKSRDGERNLVVHNIGGGQVLADCLFEYRIIGHYFYKGK